MFGSRQIWSLICAMLSVMLISVHAKAEPVRSLFNTGVDDNHMLLPDGLVDPHFSLVVSADPRYPGPDARVVNADSIAFRAGWLPNNLSSKWISPRADAFDNSPGIYVYRTTFDLTGLDPHSAVIMGRWAIDNEGVDILINQVSTGIQRPGAFGFFEFEPFTISAGFIEGVNTLEFVVRNLDTGFPNPTGFRVELTGTAGAVPEPQAITLLTLGLLGLIGYRMRKLAPINVRPSS